MYARLHRSVCFLFICRSQIQQNNGHREWLLSPLNKRLAGLALGAHLGENVLLRYSVHTVDHVRLRMRSRLAHLLKVVSPYEHHIATVASLYDASIASATGESLHTGMA